jgi:gas vesicle protein
MENPMTRNRSKWNHPVSTLFLGVAVGALVGILFAPKSGEETRDDVVGAVNDGIDEVRTRATKAARSARRFANQARERVEDAVDAGTEAYRESLRSAD